MQVRGEEAVEEWKALQDFMKPYATAASALPPAALRGDLGMQPNEFLVVPVPLGRDVQLQAGLGGGRF